MSANLKIATIVVATLAITFSSMTLVRLTATFYEDQPQKIDDGGVYAPTEQVKTTQQGPTPELLAARAKTPEVSTESAMSSKDIMSKWNDRKTTVTEKVIGIIVTLVSIFTSFTVFGTVSDDYERNSAKRHMLLPFVIFHSVTTFFHAIAICYIIFKYQQYMSAIIYLVLIYVAMVLVTMIGISFVGAYFKALSRMGGFSYAQMDDVVASKEETNKQEGSDMEKKPIV